MSCGSFSKSMDLGIILGLLLGWQRFKYLGHLPLPSQVYWQETGSEAGLQAWQPGLEIISNHFAEWIVTLDSYK